MKDHDIYTQKFSVVQEPQYHYSTSNEQNNIYLSTTIHNRKKSDWTKEKSPNNQNDNNSDKTYNFKQELINKISSLKKSLYHRDINLGGDIKETLSQTIFNIQNPNLSDNVLTNTNSFQNSPGNNDSIQNHQFYLNEFIINNRNND